MWLWLHPPCLPRPLSGIIVGAMYFPETPTDLQRTHACYIIECIDSVKSAQKTKHALRKYEWNVFYLYL